MSDRRFRVQEEIKRYISEIIQKHVKDPRLGFVSVTDVELSRDLSHAKIFVSVFGEEEEQIKTMEGLNRATGFIRTELGKRLRVRHVPELVFSYDASLEHGARINEILRELQSGGDKS